MVSKYDESRGVQKPRADDEPLDDPIAEKLRQQRLVEEADYAATMELFGSSRELDGFIPKTNKEFEEFGKLVAAKYLMGHASAKGYKGAMKSLLHVALHERLSVAEARSCLQGYDHRYDRLVDWVTETEGAFDESLLATIGTAELLIDPISETADHWVR